MGAAAGAAVARIRCGGQPVHGHGCEKVLFAAQLSCCGNCGPHCQGGRHSERKLEPLAVSGPVSTCATQYSYPWPLCRVEAVTPTSAMIIAWYRLPRASSPLFNGTLRGVGSLARLRASRSASRWMTAAVTSWPPARLSAAGLDKRASHRTAATAAALHQSRSAADVARETRASKKLEPRRPRRGGVGEPAAPVAFRRRSSDACAPSAARESSCAPLARATAGVSAAVKSRAAASAARSTLATPAARRRP